LKSLFGCILNTTSLVAKVGLVIPTLNAGPRWSECLEGIGRQSFRPDRLLIIDSSSTDQTVALASLAGFEVVIIDRSKFNHGATRQWAVDHLHDCDIVVFMTQDAIPADNDALSEIVRCFDDPEVAVAYGRQLPHHGATNIEAHARAFNYGSCSVKKGAAAVGQIGTKVFFCSNSFAAYRRSISVSLGGFRHDLILGEDMEFAARAVQAGYINMYTATATVRHSHDYSVAQLIRRYFDIGVFDQRNPWMRRQFGSHRGEGLRFIGSEFRYLKARSPLQILRAFCQNAAKLVGYRLGRIERLLPKSTKRRLSMLPGFWR
jgi:rhamnosyltransferase